MPDASQMRVAFAIAFASRIWESQMPRTNVRTNEQNVATTYGYLSGYDRNASRAYQRFNKGDTT